jgi:hypothetical protein
MELENVQRPSEIREGCNIRDFKGKSRILGDAANPSSKHGAYEIAARREDCNESSTVVTEQWTASEIPGKIVSQLIDENEKQLAYHREQVEIIENRLKELRQVPESLADINESE